MASLPDTEFEPTLAELLRRSVERYGDRDLIVMEDQRATFAQIEAQSGRLARLLIASGVGKGTRVGMHFPYSPEFLVAFLAVTRIGALAVPFSTAYAPGELRRGLRQNDIHTLLLPSQMLGRDELDFVEESIPAIASARGPLFFETLPHLRQVWVLGPADRSWCTSVDPETESPLVDDAILAAAEDEVVPADWMVVISTSGSTAEPKGVIHTHGTVIRKTSATLGLLLGASDQPQAVFAAMPLFWIGGLITLTAALANGTTMVCQDRFDADGALDLIERERCVAVSAWLSVSQALREHPSLPRRDLSSIPALTDQPAGTRPYGTVLGMTETCGPHLTQPHPVHGMDVPEALRGSLGVAAPHFDHKIIDPDSGEHLVGDVEGELCVRGYATLAGMYKRERHEVFDDDGYYHTGDRVRVEDDLYFFTGRVTEMIKTHGANVAPPEVEQVLESFEEVKFAFVVGIPDETREEVVAAVVVGSGLTELDIAALQKKARGELSSYKVPRVIVELDEAEVPWLATGKPDKRTMKDLLVRAAEAWADGAVG